MVTQNKGYPKPAYAPFRAEGALRPFRGARYARNKKIIKQNIWSVFGVTLILGNSMVLLRKIELTTKYYMIYLLFFVVAALFKCEFRLKGCYPVRVKF